MDQAILGDIHRYWFGDLAGEFALPADRFPFWFERKDETDAHIREHYGALIAPATEADWSDLFGLTREQQVGLIILLDQFPRNIFRDDARAFASDPRAREITDRLLAQGHGRYFLIERMFMYLPFEHSEAMEDQLRSMRLYEQLLADAPEAQREAYIRVLDFAARHRDLIARFGRFPHRNVMLGRPSTPEETAFMAEHGRGY